MGGLEDNYIRSFSVSIGEEMLKTKIQRKTRIMKAVNNNFIMSVHNKLIMKGQEGEMHEMEAHSV